MTPTSDEQRRPAERRRSSLIASIVEEEKVVEAVHGSGAYLYYALELVAFAGCLCD